MKNPTIIAGGDREHSPVPKLLAIHPAAKALDYFGPQAPDWGALECHPQATLIKYGRARKTWRVAMPNGAGVFAKVFDDTSGSMLAWCKKKMGVHPAMREWRALCRMDAREIPAVRPIAVAQYAKVENTNRGAGRGRLVLLTHEFENARSLIAAWSGISSARERSLKSRDLIAATSTLWATAHDRGFAHPDGHPGNVLISSAGAVFVDPVAPFLSVIRRSSLSMAKALRGMAMLDQFFHRTATRCERLRFWRDYWVRRDVLMSGTTERRLLARLAEMSIQHRSALARQRDRRLRGDGKYFAKLRLHDGWRGGVVLMLERRHLFPERHVPDQTIDEWNRICGVVIQSPQSLGIRFDRFRLIPRPPHARGKWAERLFEHTHRLRHRDIPAPLILGHLHRRRGFRLVDEYLILPSAKGEAGR